MGNIIVTFSGNMVEVNFGDYFNNSEQVDSQRSVFQKANIHEIRQDGDSVYVKMEDTKEWKLGIIQGADNFVIDSVNSTLPTDLSHLFDLLKGMI